MEEIEGSTTLLFPKRIRHSIMSQTYALPDKTNDRSLCDKMTIVVFSALMAMMLAGLGGSMAYFLWTREVKDDVTSLAEHYGIPTKLIALVMGSAALFFVALCLIALLMKCCSNQSNGSGRTNVLCPESASTQVLALSRESLPS